MAKINRQKIYSWAKAVGMTKAILLIIEKTGLSVSSADKLARGTYPAEPTPLVRRALADLTRIPESELFTKSENDTTELTQAVNS